ncbi:MAG TPA: MOSC domain-containing protein [Thermoanaerobaculia bacterium]|nr:MOSC domain-containing protein [Thermoanaerobaculia bacterium]
MGEIVRIWRKRFKRGPMDPLDEAQLVSGRGLAGNANQGGKRQLTIIDEAAWRDAATELGIDVAPSTRRANVMLRGLDLEKTRGKLLRLGECVVRVYGETRPCNQMEEAQRGLQNALDPHWRGGVFGEIVQGGTIRVGDVAEWAQSELLPSP